MIMLENEAILRRMGLSDEDFRRSLFRSGLAVEAVREWWGRHFGDPTIPLVLELRPNASEYHKYQDMGDFLVWRDTDIDGTPIPKGWHAVEVKERLNMRDNWGEAAGHAFRYPDLTLVRKATWDAMPIKPRWYVTLSPDKQALALTSLKYVEHWFVFRGPNERLEGQERSNYCVPIEYIQFFERNGPPLESFADQVQMIDHTRGGQLIRLVDEGLN
jgi:hypothetical protein